MEQQIRFCTSAGGVCIAYAVVHDGPRTVVYAAGFPSHLEVEWQRPSSRALLEALASGSTLIRYDLRGCGLSDADVSDFSLEALVGDLAAVVDASGAEDFVLLSMGMLGGPTAIAYAARQPEKVAHLVLCSAFACGERLADADKRAAVIGYTERLGFPVMDFMEGTDEKTSLDRTGREVVHLAPVSLQAALLRTMYACDVTPLLPRLTMPVTVLHGRNDRLIPFAEGRALAAALPRAEFVPIEGNTGSALTERDSTVPAIRRALSMAPSRGPAHASMCTVLFTDIESSTQTTQRLGDAAAQELVRAHNAIVREALDRHGGQEIKHTGDGIMASFGSASAAVECASEVQRAATARPGLPRVRIGLNAGEPIAEEGDLFGTTVQLARRICDAADPGDVLVSDVVRQLAAGKGFLFADAGYAALKGFDEPVRVFSLRWQTEP